MVSGRQLTKEFRRFIYNHFFNDVNPLSPKNLHRIVFGGRNDIITLSYLKKLYTKFNKNDDAENQLYLYDDGNVKLPSPPKVQTLPPVSRFIVIIAVGLPTGAGNEPATASQVIRSVEL